MRAAAFAFATCIAAPASAGDGLDQLTEAMRLDEVITILVDEGHSYGRALDDDMLGGSGGAYFHQRIEHIYARDFMRSTMRDAIDAELSPRQISEATTFFSSDLGQSIISLENSARLAFADPTVAEMASEIVEAMDPDSERYTLIEEYIEVNDLLERNVQGTLSSDYAFMRGMAAVQGTGVDDRAVLSQLWAQREATEEQTRDWVYGFLALAYQPLSNADLRENIAFSATETGQALNTALFEGFDRIYERISFDLGEAVARAMEASEL